MKTFHEWLTNKPKAHSWLEYGAPMKPLPGSPAANAAARMPQKKPGAAPVLTMPAPPPQPGSAAARMQQSGGSAAARVQQQGGSAANTAQQGQGATSSISKKENPVAWRANRQAQAAARRR